MPFRSPAPALTKRLALAAGLLLAFAFTLPGFAEQAASLAYIPRPPSQLTNAFRSSAALSYQLTLPVLNPQIKPSSRGPTQSGVVYRLPNPVSSSQLQWRPTGGGFATSLGVTIPGALRARLHVSVVKADKIEFRVQGGKNLKPIGPLDETDLRGQALWLPVTEGENTLLEIYIPATHIQSLDFSVDAVNLIAVDTPKTALAAQPESLGLTNHTKFDVACWSNNPAYPALSQAAAATAKINFIKDDASYICTGTLLNDLSNSQKPWFMSANHCLGAQNVADTASFEWFYQAQTCGGSATDSRYAQTYGGATLLWTNFNLEPAFLKLNRPPAAGVTFSGWNTNIAVGDTVWGVHHPQGDQTMASLGQVAILLTDVQDADQGGNHLLDNIYFNQGGVEPGSSGSGLFSFENGQSNWKGTLFGTESDDYQNAVYSHFAAYYPNVKAWLGPSPPVITFTASPKTVIYGQTATLSWSAKNADSCQAGGNWSGTQAISGSYLTAQLTAKQSFTLTCSGSGGNSEKTITLQPKKIRPIVKLLATPDKAPYGGQAEIAWTVTEATACAASGGWDISPQIENLQSSGSQQVGPITKTETYTLTCQGPGGSSHASAKIIDLTPPPSLSLSAKPDPVKIGAASALHWKSSHTAACQASGDWSGAQALNGSFQIPSLQAAQTFTLTCSGSGGSIEKSVTIKIKR